MNDLTMPECLRRDANNVAPFMRQCVDEGCPWHGTVHECVNPGASLPTSPPDWLPPWGAKT